MSSTVLMFSLFFARNSLINASKSFGVSAFSTSTLIKLSTRQTALDCKNLGLSLLRPDPQLDEIGVLEEFPANVLSATSLKFAQLEETEDSVALILEKRLVWAGILFLLITAMPMMALPRVSAYSEPLPLHSWWTLKGSYVRVYSGSQGNRKGTYTETGNYTDKILVTGQDSNTTTLSEQVNGTWHCTATDAWSEQWGYCGTPSGSWSNTTDYTVVSDTLVVVAVGQNWNKQDVGYGTYLLENLAGLTEGGTDNRTWWVPNADSKGSTPKFVDWSVGTRRMNINGVSLKVWTTTYTGDTLGELHNRDGVYSKGQETDTLLYDSAYGILIGSSWRRTVNGNDAGATWTEEYSEDELLEDTSPLPVTLNIEPHTGVAVTIDGTKYGADQFPVVLDWAFGTTHTLQVDPIIQGAGGVQYVFVQWSDGSNDTSRTLTAPQEASLTATFKTQYVQQDNTMLYVIIGVVVVAIIVAVLLLMRRKPTAVPTAAPAAEAAAPSVQAAETVAKPTTAPMGATEFCVHCGAKIPKSSKFCGECGSKLSE